MFILVVVILVFSGLYLAGGFAFVDVARSHWGPVQFKKQWMATSVRFLIILFWPVVGAYVMYMDTAHNDDRYL